jgi:hypothetical protein
MQTSNFRTIDLNNNTTSNIGLHPIVLWMQTVSKIIIKANCCACNKRAFQRMSDSRPCFRQILTCCQLHLQQFKPGINTKKASRNL